MGVYTHSQGNWLSRRGTFLILLVVFHIALLWLIKSGLAVKFVKSITEPIKAEIINEVKPEEPPPPPPDVKIEQPPVQVPPILVDIPLPPAPPPMAITPPTTTKPVPPPPPAPPPPVVRVPVKVTYMPDLQDYYPSVSRNLEEQGLVKVRVCVDVKGHPSQAEVAETSKYPRLDAAALKVAQRMRFRPATEDGKKVETCPILPIRFTLNN